VYVANAPRPEQRHVFRMPLRGGEPVRVSEMPGTHAPVVSPDGRYAAVLFSSDSLPPELLLTSLDRGGEQRITNSPRPELAQHSWVAPDYVTFPSHVDGTTLHGRLLVPSGLDRSRKHPAIIGSIYANTVRNQWGGRNAHPVWGLDQLLLQEGYVLLNVDVRGSWGHGKAFRRGIRLDYGGIDVEDIASGVRYLESLDFVDMDRVGIWGSSYGGLLTCMSLFRKPELFRAGVAGAPATNVFHALTGEMRVMMAPQDEPQAYEKASPLTHAAGLEDPLLVIHGMRDPIVLYQDSVALVQKLIGLGKNVDFVTLPAAGHGWDLEDLAQTRFAYRKLVEFFDRHLKGTPP
jgi:dipeptidyl-peptidase-4